MGEARVAGALRRVLTSWAGKTAPDEPEDTRSVLVSHRSVTTKDIQKSTANSVQHEEAWWAGKYKWKMR